MRIVVSLLIATLVVACTKQPPPQDHAGIEQQQPPPASHAENAAKVVLSAPRGELTVYVEVVASETALTKGLMYRQFLPPDDGMLFYMGKEKDWTFYMRNTLIPLDMIFITKDMSVAGVYANATPLTEDLRSVGSPSLFVLEVNGGWAASHGVSAGTKVRFDNTEAAAH